VGRRTRHYTEERQDHATSTGTHYYNFAVHEHGEHAKRTSDEHLELPGHP
jgi:hypothetical protein